MTFIIAEAGINHCGDLARAKEMVWEAANAGADAVKFQSYNVEALGYTDAALNEMLDKCRLTPEAHHVLMEQAEIAGIEFMSTPFDLTWAEALKSMGVKRMKISSGKVKDLPFITGIAALELPVIMSCGMATDDDILKAEGVFLKHGVSFDLLYCISEYPAPLHKINFHDMWNLKWDSYGTQNFWCEKVGFSDHTLTGDASIIAAASGAEIIERHFTLDRSLSGPDQCCSSTPEELKWIIGEIRNVG